MGMFSSKTFHGESLWVEVVIAAGLGVCAHIFFYKHGEHHMEAPVLFWVHVCAFAIMFYAKAALKVSQQTVGEALLLPAAYIIALFASIVVYRKIFHRLRKFPGPAMASVTKLWHTASTLDCQNHLLLDKLHKQYGDFVRTGG